MADRGADGSAVEFMHDFAYLLPVTVICELIGIPEADRESFRPVARDMAGVFELNDPARCRRSTPPPSSCWPTSPGWRPRAAPSPRDDLHQRPARGQRLRRRPADRRRAAAQPDAAAGGRLRDDDEPARATGCRSSCSEPRRGRGRPGRVGAARPRSSRKCCATTRRSSSPRRVGYDTKIGGRCRVRSGDSVLTMIGAGNRDPRRFAEPGQVRPAARGRRAAELRRRRALLHRRRARPARGRDRVPAAAEPVPEIAAAGEPVRRETFLLRGFDALPVTVI